MELKQKAGSEGRKGDREEGRVGGLTGTAVGPAGGGSGEGGLGRNGVPTGGTVGAVPYWQ